MVRRGSLDGEFGAVCEPPSGLAAMASDVGGRSGNNGCRDRGGSSMGGGGGGQDTGIGAVEDCEHAGTPSVRSPDPFKCSEVFAANGVACGVAGSVAGGSAATAAACATAAFAAISTATAGIIAGTSGLGDSPSILGRDEGQSPSSPTAILLLDDESPTSFDDGAAAAALEKAAAAGRPVYRQWQQ